MATPRVLFVSQRQAESMRPPRDALLISITDPGQPPAQRRDGWKAILRVQFHDVDSVTFPGMNPTLQGITASQTGLIAAFLATETPAAQRLMVHCKSGVSRSAGVAKVAALWLRVPFPADYAEYNRQVFSLVSRALSRLQNEV